jgi:hypothetical protein
VAKSITASVGRMGGINRVPDVKAVQELLNQVPVTSGGPSTKLGVTGTCGADTVAAIQRFQLHHFGLSGADGRVDPGGRTLAKLNEFDAPGSPATPVARQVFGTIVEVQGHAVVSDFLSGGAPAVPATVGMALRTSSGVFFHSNDAGVRVRLTNGRTFAVTGSGLVIDPAV